VKDILDRNGFKPKDVVVVEGDIVAALNRGLARAGKPAYRAGSRLSRIPTATKPLAIFAERRTAPLRTPWVTTRNPLTQPAGS
jgi:hypothetical protein